MEFGKTYQFLKGIAKEKPTSLIRWLWGGTFLMLSVSKAFS